MIFGFDANLGSSALTSLSTTTPDLGSFNKMVFYNKNYDIVNNADHFSFEIECTQNSMRIKFLNRSTTLTLRMKIAELKLFY